MPLQIFRLSRTYKTVRRLRQVTNIFLKHGFGGMIDQIQLGRFIPFGKRLRAFGHWPEMQGLTVAERMRVALGELGPSFVKFAQILASRPDLVTERYASEFSKLQDRVPPFPVEDAMSIIESETGKPMDEVFASFDHTPLAAASIAQVHKATLLGGEEVIVKVQRPGIREQIEADAEILATVASLVEKNMIESRFFNPTGIVSEFRRIVRKELNFTLEARNAEKFSRNFSGFEGIRFPWMRKDLCTDRVLVMERLDGVRVDDVEGMKAFGVETKEIARRGVDMYFKMVLDDGFFHGDPHPGNIIVTRDGEICIVDFGIVGRVDDDLRELLAGTFTAVVKKDMDRLIDQYVELGIVPEELDRGRFRHDLKEDLLDIIEPVLGLPLKQLNISEIMGSVIKTAVKHHLRVPGDLLLIHKVLLMLEGLGTRLDPSFDFVEVTGPYVKKLVSEKFDPMKIRERAEKYAAEASDFVAYFPRQMKRIVKKVLRDDMNIKFTHRGLEPFIRDMDRSSNRIAFALVLSAILLSSAIMHATGVGPTFYGMSVLGLVVFGFAAVLGIWLLISILRSGRL